MYTFRFLTFSLFLSMNTVVYGQFFQSLNPSLDFTFAAGVSSYYGDLVQDNPVFREPSFCFSTGLAYNFNPNLVFRGDISYMQIRAWDGNNSRADLKARNLSFKSNILDIDVSVEVNMRDITGDHKVTPYVFFGVGGCHFNPYTTDRFGQ